MVVMFGLAGDFAGRMAEMEMEMEMVCNSWVPMIPTPLREEEQNREKHTMKSKHHHKTRHHGLPASEAGERAFAGEQGLRGHRTKGNPG